MHTNPALLEGMLWSMPTIQNEVAIPDRELVNLSELKVDGNNPNVMSPQQHERLATSIKKYGFIVPIITNKDLLIADGEQRLTVAKSLNMSQVPVIRLPVEDVDRRLLRQVLNKLRGEHEPLLDADEFEKIITLGKEDDLKYLLALDDVKLQMLRSTLDNDVIREYGGMPNFLNDNLSERVIIIHFKSDVDVQEFAQLIDQKITLQTKYIWFPQQDYDRTANLRVVSES